MATTVNGFIAKEDDDVSFVTKVDWESFISIAKRIGNIIVGRRTYEIMYRDKQFEELDGIKIVVLTRNQSFMVNRLNHYVARMPKDALDLLVGQGFQEALVCGGGNLNASFLINNLIDEIYLDIEPVVFGRGIRLFAEDRFENKLHLLEVRKLSEETVQLHYQVLK